jgi:hypothetical protein
MDELEQKLKEKYKCTASDNGGWCDGTKIGASLRCPKAAHLKDRSKACNLGIEKGLDEMMCMESPNAEITGSACGVRVD